MDFELTPFSTPPLTPKAAMDNKNAEYYKVEEGKNISPDKLKPPASMSISPELFERLYLSPREPVKEDTTRGFANPTPV
jgi:hypothetical protein